MKNEWLEIREKDGYFWAHFKKGDGVMVLPYRQTKQGVEVMLRLEHRPCHDAVFSSLTGIIEAGEVPIETAMRELNEEGGFNLISSTFLKPVGWVYPVKFSDHKCYIYLMNMHGFEQTEPKGDGSKMESEAKNVWVHLKHALNTNDALVGAALAHLALEGWLE